MSLEKQRKLEDINNIDFGGTPDETIASMEIVLMMIEIDTNPDIIEACKKRLQEGLELLKKMGLDKTKDFTI